MAQQNRQFENSEQLYKSTSAKNAQQTALQSFWNKIALKLSVEQINEFLPEFQEAKAMEKEQMTELVQRLKDYTAESHNILGHDEREASEFVEEYYNQTYDRATDTK